jgi:heme/copper-type cytochrome/quinol oxidase subunit 3
MFVKSLILASIEYLASVSGETQVLITLIIIILNLQLTMAINPLNSKEGNINNTASQSITLLTMYWGIFYMTGKGYEYMQPGGADFFFLPTLFISSFSFFIFIFYRIIYQLLIMVLKRNE